MCWVGTRDVGASAWTVQAKAVVGLARSEGSASSIGRASDYGSGGWRFESSVDRAFFSPPPSTHTLAAEHPAHETPNGAAV